MGHFAYQSFVEATKLCRTFRHEYVELEHWLKVLVDKERGDLPLILAHYAINIQRVSDALDRILHTLPNRTNAVVDLSTQLETVVERGLLMSQLAETPSGGVRTIHILVGILQDPTLQRSLYRLSEEFKKLPIPQLFDDYPVILAESVEHEEEEEESYGALGEAPDAPETVEILDKWCADLTRQARDGEIDPVIGREAELRQVIDILLRRRQNNPILVGQSRGRQNGGGGSAGLQDSPRAGAAAAAGRPAAVFGSRAHAGWGKHAGRIRIAPESADRRHCAFGRAGDFVL